MVSFCFPFFDFFWAPVGQLSRPGSLLGVSIYLFGHGLVVAAAAVPGHGQVALGTKKVARTWTGAGPGPGGPGPGATFFAPSATCPWLGAAAARPWPNK